jgi:hypothetical protein
MVPTLGTSARGLGGVVSDIVHTDLVIIGRAGIGHAGRCSITHHLSGEHDRDVQSAVRYIVHGPATLAVRASFDLLVHGASL